MLRETIETGIICAGEILPNTNWCLRQSSAWWDPTDRDDLYQMRPREGVTDIICGHWTAGEAGAKSYEDDGPRVVSVMKRRKSRKRPGRRLKVSVQFVIGACNELDEFAPVWQTMDIGGGWAAVHVGRGSINSRSIGVEVVSAGLDGQPNVRHRPERDVYLLGKKRQVLEFYPGQIRSWVRLANALSGVCIVGGIEIPRRVPVTFVPGRGAYILPRRFSRNELNDWCGGMEHYLMDNTRKVDAGTMLLEALLIDGWSPANL